jgi:hypothetical protein
MNFSTLVAPEDRVGSARRPATWFLASFVAMAAVYVLQLFVPDPLLSWAQEDESCCHVPTILLFQRRGLIEAAKDYPSATTPLYHILMATVYGRVPDLWLRLTWVMVTLGVGWVLYRHILDDDRVDRGSPAAGAIAMGFLMNPTVRAAAVYFVTDGLPLDLAIISLVLLSRTNVGSPLGSRVSAGMALVAAHASFLTRQYYVWVPMYVTHSLLAGCSRMQQAAVVATSGMLLLPALGLFLIWRRVIPPSGSGAHTDAHVLASLPSALAFLAISFVPVVALAVRDLIADARLRVGSPVSATWRPLVVVAGLVVYVGLLLAEGFEVPIVGRILRTLAGPLFGQFGSVLFLVMSYCGLVILVRWLVMDGARQLWWVVFLLPFAASGFLAERYLDPVGMLFLFLVARPRDAERILNGRLVWFYPAFSVAYSVGRLLVR